MLKFGWSLLVLGVVLGSASAHALPADVLKCEVQDSEDAFLGIEVRPSDREGEIQAELRVLDPDGSQRMFYRFSGGNVSDSKIYLNETGMIEHGNSTVFYLETLKPGIYRIAKYHQTKEGESFLSSSGKVSCTLYSE